MRVPLAVVLAALVVLAGCGAPAGPTSRTDAGSRSPVPAGTTPSPGQAGSPAPSTTRPASPTPPPERSVETFPYPEGAGADGFDDPAAVGASQERLLANHSHVVRIRQVVRTGPGAGTRERTTLRVGEQARRVEMGERGGDASERRHAVSSWVGPDGTAVRIRAAPDGGDRVTAYYVYEAAYRQVEPIHLSFRWNHLPPRSTGAATVENYLRAFEYEAVERFRRDGHASVRYRSTGVASVDTHAGVLRRDLASTNLTVVMRDDGLVTSVRGTFVTVVEGDRSRRAVNYGVSRWGRTDPERPDWAASELPQVEVEAVGNGTVLRVSHAGGRPVRETELGASSPDGSAEVTLGRFDGETVYVTADRANGTLDPTLHGSQPPADAGTVNFSAVGPLVVVVDGNRTSLHLLVGRAVENGSAGAFGRRHRRARSVVDDATDARTRGPADAVAGLRTYAVAYTFRANARLPETLST